MIDYLHKHGYYVVEDFFTEKQVGYYLKQSMESVVKKEMSLGTLEQTIQMHHKTWNVNSHPIWENTLYTLLPSISKIVDEDLIPTYSYQRIYLKGSKMAHHTDWPYCQISLTINLGQSDEYPIYITDMDTKKSVEVIQKPGDAILYLGHNTSHYRGKFEGDWYSQLFLHYVINNEHMQQYDRFDFDEWKFKFNEDTSFLYPKKLDEIKEGVGPDFDYEYDMNFQNEDKINPLDRYEFQTTNKHPNFVINDLDINTQLEGGQYDNKILTNFMDSIHQTYNALSPKLCTDLIELYDEYEKNGEVRSGTTHRGLDDAIKDTGEIDLMRIPEGEPYVKELTAISDSCFKEYFQKFGLDKHYDVGELTTGGVYYPMWEIHKYEKGKGHYEAWHTEGSQMFEFGNRMFVSMFYLNDVEEGGRTVFPYSRFGIKCEEGKHLAFPTMWPYVHYAQTPLSDHKYILTTWLQKIWPNEYYDLFMRMRGQMKDKPKQKTKFIFEEYK